MSLTNVPHPENFSVESDKHLSSLTPRPAPGYESETEELTYHNWLNVLAAAVRAITGVLFIAASLLYVPTGIWTPIMTGVGMMMVTTGLLNLWQLKRRYDVLTGPVKIMLYLLPALCALSFALMLIFGAGAFGPDWQKLANDASSPD